MGRTAPALQTATTRYWCRTSSSGGCVRDSSRQRSRSQAKCERSVNRSERVTVDLTTSSSRASGTLGCQSNNTRQTVQCVLKTFHVVNSRMMISQKSTDTSFKRKGHTNFYIFFSDLVKTPKTLLQIVYLCQEQYNSTLEKSTETHLYRNYLTLLLRSRNTAKLNHKFGITYEIMHANHSPACGITLPPLFKTIAFP